VYFTSFYQQLPRGSCAEQLKSRWLNYVYRLISYLYGDAYFCSIFNESETMSRSDPGKYFRFWLYPENRNTGSPEAIVYMV
jgi:hypothetical protein